MVTFNYCSMCLRDRDDLPGFACLYPRWHDPDGPDLYCLPREAGDRERVAAGLAQAAIAEGLAREDEERARGIKEEAGGP